MGQGAGGQCRGQPHALPGPGSWAPAPLLSVLPSTDLTTDWFAPPAMSQRPAFPYSRSGRDALPVAPWGSSSLLPDGDCSGRCCLPGRACCCTASPPISAPASRTAGALGACPAPAPRVTQTGPAAREQGVKGHANIWREAQPIPPPGLPADTQRLGVRGSPGAVPPAPCRVAGGACWQHPSDAAGLRTPGSSAQLAHRPPAHLEPLRQVQAHGEHSSEGRAAAVPGASQAWGRGVPLHPTRATPGRAAVPTHSPVPSLEISSLVPALEHHTHGLGCRAGAGCRMAAVPANPSRMGGILCQHPLTARECLLEGQTGWMGGNKGHKQTVEEGWQQDMGTAVWGGSARAA